ncbi:uncharacterized protein FPRO_07228 [Fusarium proliferatum ET1]|uniref:Nephrocystin 3-like N-terminal domain-containing protein n=1 Tax=Fusarium proliferatum (strain ET1) TaxID=1227346 RepID=A0A1L7VVK0_FUSPR|nr:uncharacterized protein FPRO_07228 [Fusarium proliferatum ET1]CZR43855.1 uncharacterized protein FPRO_07228 [Fusarium proliferatum ET1]
MAFSGFVRKTDIPLKALTVSFFFNARGDLLEKSVSGMYRSLLLQLLQGFPDIQIILDDPDLIARNQVICPPLNVLKDLFRSAVSSLGNQALTCFIDALDECDEQQIRDMVEFFEEVAEQCVEDNMKFQVCFSSRHYPYIDIKSGIRLTLEGQDGHSEDLKRYISRHLRIKDPPLVEELTAMMLEKAAGVFLWVALVVDILNEENRHGRIALRTRLRQVPNELSALFQDILTRDKGHLERLLLSILWILLAERPLQPGEYYHALWSGLLLRQKGDPEMPPVNSTDISDCFNKFVISSSKGLAEITKSKKPTVQFIHESVRDFLIKDKGLYTLWPTLAADWKSQGHEELKLCCNTYIFHETVREALDKQNSTHTQDPEESLLEQFPFLGYASQCVLHHADAAAHEIIQQEFLSEFPLPKWITIFNVFEKHKIRKYDLDANILYILAERGYSNLIRTNLEISPGIEGAGGRYPSPLLAAMAKGNKGSVAALLGLPSRIYNGVDITDKLKCRRDSVRKGQTPFAWACEEGHLAIAQLLLQNGSRVIEADLVRVTVNGHSEIAKMLLGKGADVRAVNKDGTTALHGALSKCDFETAKILLDKGADVTAVGRGRRTPLHEASAKGHLEFVKILLDKGADVTAVDWLGSTPLHLTSDSDIAMILLDKGADITVTDHDRRTILHRASSAGSVELVKILLEKGADVNAVSKDGKTALHHSTSAEVTTLLLEKGADITATDTDGWTSLHFASLMNRLEVVKALLEKGAGITAKNNSGRTSYDIARWRHPQIAMILLEKEIKDSSVRDVN